MVFSGMEPCHPSMLEVTASLLQMWYWNVPISWQQEDVYFPVWLGNLCLVVHGFPQLLSWLCLPMVELVTQL